MLSRAKTLQLLAKYNFDNFWHFLHKIFLRFVLQLAAEFHVPKNK